MEKRAKYNPPTPFYDKLMKKGKEYEIAVQQQDLDRRATQSKWASFKDGKFLLDSTNIEDQAKKDEKKAMKITQQMNMEKEL